MKRYVLIITLLVVNIISSQNVVEYNVRSEMTLKIYSEAEGKFYKISEEKDFKQNTPEAVAVSYFFAYSNDLVSRLYLDKEKYAVRDSSMFEGIKTTNNKDAYVELLHKTTYDFQGNHMAYIMFIAKVKGISFRFPTILSLIKKGDKWFIHQRPNQKKLINCLMMFKPCVLSNLAEGKSKDNDISNLISRAYTSGLDYVKLFDELVKIKKNKKLAAKLTLSQDANCSAMDFKKEIEFKCHLTGIFEDMSIRMLKKNEDELISHIDHRNDSILLRSSISFEYSGRKYEVIKYKRISSNGKEKLETLRLDKQKKMEQPVKELLFLFENLNTAMFSDLAPRLNKTRIMDSELYHQSRGVYDVLNISKLYKLYKERPSLFKNYEE